MHIYINIIKSCAYEQFIKKENRNKEKTIPACLIIIQEEKHR